MRVTAGLDSGPVATGRGGAGRGDDDDYAALSARLADVSGELVVRALDALAAGQLEFTEQDEAEATYAEKISPGGAPPRPGAAARRSSSGSCGALTPHIGAYLELDDGEQTRGAIGACRAPDGPVGGRDRGSTEGELAARLVGRRPSGSTSVQPAGKKPMSAADFLRGHDVPAKAV